MGPGAGSRAGMDSGCKLGRLVANRVALDVSG